jgi:hypothetical protein
MAMAIRSNVRIDDDHRGPWIETTYRIVCGSSRPSVADDGIIAMEDVIIVHPIARTRTSLVVVVVVVVRASHAFHSRHDGTTVRHRPAQEM